VPEGYGGGGGQFCVAHVQKLPVRVLLVSLEDGESKCEKELLPEDEVAALQKKALEESACACDVTGGQGRSSRSVLGRVRHSLPARCPPCVHHPSTLASARTGAHLPVRW
jgi:hypothetical protein